MLNPFPDLLTYGILAPMMIRIAVGAAFFYLAVLHFRAKGDIAHSLSPMIGALSKTAPTLWVLVELIVGFLLVAGAWTQYAAILASVIVIKSLLLKNRHQALVPYSKATYILLLVMCLSLILSGAGGFAFDLPL